MDGGGVQEKHLNKGRLEFLDLTCTRMKLPQYEVKSRSVGPAGLPFVYPQGSSEVPVRPSSLLQLMAKYRILSSERSSAPLMYVSVWTLALSCY